MGLGVKEDEEGVGVMGEEGVELDEGNYYREVGDGDMGDVE